MLATRIVTAVVLVAVVFGVLFLLPPLGWAIVSLAAIGAAAFEWAELAGCARARAAAFAAATVAIGAALLLGTAFERGWPFVVLAAACGLATAFWLFVAPAWLARRAPPESRLARLAAGCVVLVGAWVAIVDLEARSPWLVLAAMAIVWIADTAAYFSGRAFGRHKLAPQVSPGKTWEGVAGGLVVVAAYALAISALAPRAGFAPGVAATALLVACAVALAALSVVGDLTESLLKRSAGVKDSGRLLPGHGGVLDRVDALLAAMPPAALLVASLLP